jgi:hypothetical protein
MEAIASSVWTTYWPHVATTPSSPPEERTIVRKESDMTTGYSGTPLARKLGVKDDQRTWRHEMPHTVAEEIARSGVMPTLLNSPTSGLQMAHIFVTRRRELARLLTQLRPRLVSDGAIWVSWPKKSAKVETDIVEETIREEALSIGFVDVKVCAVDETWSGLKLVIRKSERAKA